MSRSPTVSQQRIRFLDIELTDYRLGELIDEISAGVRAHDRRIVANHNLHSLYLFHHRERLRAFYQMVSSSHIDGMPLVWIARLQGLTVAPECRITYVDLMPPLLKRAQEQRWKIFYLGSKPAACEQGAAVIRKQYPGIVWLSADGYFDAARDSVDSQEIVARIAKFDPDLLMVGMGMPRQEEWIAENLPQLRAGVILPCGAAIDFMAGVVPTPPRWAGRLGLEWLFRLLAEPRRLASRYLVEPWYILMLLLRNRLRPRRK